MADDSLSKIEKELKEVQGERESLILDLANETKETEALRDEKNNAEASLDAIKDELTKMKEQLELKDRTIQRLRTTSTRARSAPSDTQETEAYEKEIKELRMELKLEHIQRRQIAESSLTAEER